MGQGLNNHFQNFGNKNITLGNAIDPVSVESIKLTALMYQDKCAIKPVSSKQLEEIKEKLAALREEVSKTDVEPQLKEFIQKHILKIESMIIDYQLYGTEFLDEAIKDFLSTAMIVNKDANKESTLWKKFEALGNKFIFVSKAVDSTNKIASKLAPLLGLLG